jgi:hypothetical protein
MTDAEIEQIKELSISIDRIVSLLTEDYPIYMDLEAAFVWSNHPRGESFWRKECNKLEKYNPLSKEAREELERIIIIKELT